jgi:hypothetical protein
MNYGETVNTLHYANRTRNIKNRVIINQEWLGAAGFGGDKEIKALRSTISQLRTEIALIRAGVQPTDSSNQLETRENQYIHRRERDLMCEISAVKSKLNNANYNNDQAKFYVCRLGDRVKELLVEVVEISKERDVASMEKARLMNPAFIDYQKAVNEPLKLVQINRNETELNEMIEIIDIGDEQASKKETCIEVSNSPEVQLYQLIQHYQTTIAKLRFQLSEADDKLAWQREAMMKFKNNGPRIAWGEDALKQIGVKTKPEKIIDKVKMSNAEIRHEKLLMKGLRENIEIKAKLSQDGMFSDISQTSFKSKVFNF